MGSEMCIRDSYDADSTTGGVTTAATSIGILPVDSDGDGIADYIDTNSDDEGGDDAAERGDGQQTTIATGASTSANDADGDGLFDVFENGSSTDGFVVNEGITNPIGVFGDSDGDAILSNPLSNDLDYRDAIQDIDTDNDGIAEVVDIDDDNDGCLLYTSPSPRDLSTSRMPSSA